LKKLMIVGAMLVMLLLVAIPAIAQVSEEFGQGIEDTGNVTTSTTVTSSGDNGNQCVSPLQFGNTGNVQNAQGFLQYASESGDIEFGGSSMAFAPVVQPPNPITPLCQQTVQQAAAGG
jgi:hypothetical protein